jgi:hypothetical protein
MIKPHFTKYDFCIIKECIMMYDGRPIEREKFIAEKH